MFLAVFMFLCMFKNVFYESVKTCFLCFFYLQINVFNIYELINASVTSVTFSCDLYHIVVM